MKRNTMLKIVNPILGVLVVNQLVTGFASRSLSYETFGLLHKDGAIALAVAAVLHLLLNAGWIRNSYLKRTRPSGA